MTQALALGQGEPEFEDAKKAMPCSFAASAK